MPTATHEVLHRLFQEHANLFPRMLSHAMDVDFPEPTEVSVLNIDLTEIEPAERRADTCLQLMTDRGKHVLIVESQLADKELKRRRWPHYVAYLHDKHKCPVTLLVVTDDRATARWARRPMCAGLAQLPCQTTQAVVFGPDNVPIIDDAETAARDPWLAAFSAVVHRHQPYAVDMVEPLVEAFASVDPEQLHELITMTGAGLGDTAPGQLLRSIMLTMNDRIKWDLREEWTDEGRAEGEAKGRVEGEANAVLTVLRARGLEVSEQNERRVRECTDRTQLEQLLARAVTVTSADDLFR